MRYRSLALAALCTFTLAACTKTSPFLENNQDYIGQWTNDTNTLKIEKNGDVKYSQHQKSEDKTSSSDIKVSTASDIKAPITAFNEQHFQIGDGALSKNFYIDKPPYKQNGKWQVVLNGQVYTRN